MMKCHNYEELMDLYLDGQLDPEEKADFEEHLSTCEHCQQSMDMLKMMNDALHDIPMVDLPEGFSDELHARLVEESSDEKNDEKESKVIAFRRVTKKPWFKALGSLAAVLVIALVIVPQLPGIDMEKTSTDESYVYGNYDYGDTTEASMDAPMEAAPMDAPNIEAQPTVMLSEESKSIRVDGISANALTANQKGSKPIAEENRKIIRNANVNVDTTTYDQYVAELTRIVEQVGGYVSSQNAGFNRFYHETSEDNLRYMNITVRIPEEQFTKVVDGLGQFGIIKSKNVTTNDITDSYRDTEAEIANLKITEERLRDILKTAEKTEDILEIERELTRVRGQLNNYTQNLVQWDRLVSLSTINIYIAEVDAYEGEIKPLDPTLGERMQGAFNDSITAIVEGGERLLVNIVGFTPYLPFWLVLLVVGFIVYRIVRKRGK